MKTRDMLSLLFSYIDFVGVVTAKTYTPSLRLKKKALKLTRTRFEEWKVSAIIMKN